MAITGQGHQTCRFRSYILVLEYICPVIFFVAKTLSKQSQWQECKQAQSKLPLPAKFVVFRLQVCRQQSCLALALVPEQKQALGVAQQARQKVACCERIQNRFYILQICKLN